MSSEREDILKLREALQESLDHHEYCGWGDNWERECAEPLQKKIDEVMTATAHYEEKPDEVG